METRWYLFPGQTMQNTKAEDRGHALHITKSAWKNITNHLDRNRLLQEAIDMEEAAKKAKKLATQEMTKDWDNSVENIRKRKEEARLERIKKEEEEQLTTFYRLRDEQEELRQKYIAKAEKSIYISTGYPKTLNGALILSEVLYGREAQIKHSNMIKAHEHEEVMKEAANIKKGAEDESRENQAKRDKLEKKKLEMRALYLKQMAQNAKEAEDERQKKIERELDDHVKAAREMEQIKKNEFEESRRIKQDIMNQFKQFIIEQQQYKENVALEDAETDNVINIYVDAKKRIDCKRKIKDAKERAAKEERRRAMGEKARAGAMAKADAEEKILQKAKEERDRLLEEERLAKEEYQKRLVKELKEEREKFLEREKKREEDMREVKKWEKINMYKVNHVTEQYEEDKRQKAWQNVLNYRADLLKQMEEDRERREREDESGACADIEKQKFAKDDERFEKYAQECLDYAKKRGRTTYPIEKVIIDYKKENNLPYPKDDRCSQKNPQLMRDSPGQMQHHPKYDPTFKCKRCKCKLFN